MPGVDRSPEVTPARSLAPAAAGPEVDRLAAAAAAYAGAASAPNTRRAYKSDWRDFAAWCASHQVQSLPAEGRTVAYYLIARAEAGLRVSSLERRIAAIRTAHKVADHPIPDDAELRAVWSGIRRTHGRPPDQKRALITEDLRRMVARLPAGLAGLRDKAILLVGFAGALRRSELASLELASGKSLRRGARVAFVAGGVEISIDASKGDQEGRGVVIAIPKGRTRLCPVDALAAWLQAAGISEGPIFRAIDRHGRIAPRAITDKTVADVVKRSARRARIDPASVGGHSLRSGLVTQAIMNEVAAPVIMKQTRHANLETMNTYIRMAERFTKNAAGNVGL